MDRSTLESLPPFTDQEDQPVDVATPQQSSGHQLESTVVQMSYTGGIIGMFSNDRQKLQDEIQRWNNDGYRLRHVLPGKPGLFAAIIQMVCLFFTMMLWAPVPGEALVFERG